GTTLKTIAGCPNVEMGGVTRTLSTPVHQFDFITKVDMNLGPNTITSRFLFNRLNAFNTDAFATAAAGYPANVPDLNQQFMMSWTRNLTSRMVNEARVSFGRLNGEFGGNSIGNTIPADGAIGQALANITFNSTSTNMPFGPATNAPQGR